MCLNHTEMIMGLLSTKKYIWQRSPDKFESEGSYSIVRLVAVALLGVQKDFFLLLH